MEIINQSVDTKQVKYLQATGAARDGPAHYTILSVWHGGGREGGREDQPKPRSVSKVIIWLRVSGTELSLSLRRSRQEMSLTSALNFTDFNQDINQRNIHPNCLPNAEKSPRTSLYIFPCSQRYDSNYKWATSWLARDNQEIIKCN